MIDPREMLLAIKQEIRARIAEIRAEQGQQSTIWNSGRDYGFVEAVKIIEKHETDEGLRRQPWDIALKFERAGRGLDTISYYDLDIIEIRSLPEGLDTWPMFCATVYRLIAGEEFPGTPNTLRPERLGDVVAGAIRKAFPGPPERIPPENRADPETAKRRNPYGEDVDVSPRLFYST